MTYIPISTSSSESCDGCPKRRTRSKKEVLSPGKIAGCGTANQGACTGPAVLYLACIDMVITVNYNTVSIFLASIILVLKNVYIIL